MLRNILFHIYQIHSVAILNSSMLALSGVRRTQPLDIDADAVLQALRLHKEDVEADIRRVRDDINAPFFKQSWDKSVDKEALYKYKALVAAMLMANPSGIFKKTVVKKAIGVWNEELGGPLSKGGRVDTTAMGLINLVQMVTTARKSMTTGSRSPSWLVELTKLLDVDAAAADSVPPCAEEFAIVPHTAPRDEPPPQKRRLLIRLATDITSSTDDAPEDPQDHCTAHVEPAPKLAGHLYWYSSATAEAYRQFAGHASEVATQRVLDHPSGFLAFQWLDGSQWVSNEPALDHVESVSDLQLPMPKASVQRKPSQVESVMKKPGGIPRGQSEQAKYKRFHSKRWHSAAQQYQQLCAKNRCTW